MDMGCCYSEFHALCDRQLSDDRITRETLSNNNPCPSSPSSTIYIYQWRRKMPKSGGAHRHVIYLPSVKN